METTTTRQSIVCSCCNGTGRIDVINGAALRARREAAGVSLRSVATAMQISAAYLSDMELGNRPIHDAMLERFEKIVGPETDIAIPAKRAYRKRGSSRDADK